ncbi:GDSL esterase/lipase At5g45910-like [Nicotiana tomentosiformis]|uniref:GDSL esterase/lipase At5g45910-like n=1 Tax=Nicotiana tomentosiformis TaxID=4098 RepID=UPI00388CDD24
MASLTNHCFFIFLLVISSFFFAQAETSPFYSIHSFGDSDSASTSDHLAAVLGLPSLQKEGVEFESGTRFFRKLSVFMDQPGFNDYKHSLLHTKSISEVSKLVPDVVETIKSSIEQLIKDAEAKHFVVSGIIPIGCLPGFRTMFPDNSRKIQCHKGLNLFATLHNDHLWQALEELRLKYPEVEIIYADYFKGFMAVTFYTIMRSWDSRLRR